MISSGTFIRDTIKGAFCLFESMASWLPLVDEMIIIDLGSTDGTLDIMKEIASANRKIKLYQSQFSCLDAKAFADAANQVVDLWSHEVGIFWQADEIPHERVVAKLLSVDLEERKNLAFWRYQLRENFQKIKWYPHPVHRLGTKSMKFVGDGMNSDGVFGVDVFSLYDHNMGWFTKWGSDFADNPTDLPTDEMLLDVSLIGAFRDNIVERRALHAPMWHEQPTIEGIPADVWKQRELYNFNWTIIDTKFNIPHIMKHHLGYTRYEVRPELIEALKNDNTYGMVGI